jgi:ankyrin repeat protein
MKDQIAVFFEERIFNDLYLQLHREENISPLLQNIFNKIENILSLQKISSQDELIAEEANKLLKILNNIKPKDKSEEDRVITEIQKMEVFFNQKQKRKSYELFELRPLLLKAAILLDDIESIRIIMTYIKYELDNKNSLFNKKINFSMLAKYALDKKHLDLLDYPIIYETIEGVLFKDPDYKLKIFLEADTDIIAKITAKNPDLFKKTVGYISVADLKDLYNKTNNYIIESKNNKDAHNVKRRKMELDTNPYYSPIPSIIKDVIFHKVNSQECSFNHYNYQNTKNTQTIKRNAIEIESDTQILYNTLNHSVVKEDIIKLNRLINIKDYSTIPFTDERSPEVFYQLSPEIFKTIPKSEINNILFWLCKNPKNYNKFFLDFLFKIEADKELSDMEGLSPIHYAVENGHIELVEYLLNYGANIESKDYSDKVALHYAAENGHTEIVKLLLNNGANMEAKSNINYTALHFSILKGYLEIVELLLENGANMEVKNNEGQTPLLAATRKGNDDIVKLLLNAGANIEAMNNTGQVPLINATENCYPKIVKLLLNAGANIEAKHNFFYYTALNLAAARGYTEIIRLLLENGASIKTKDQGGYGPLHNAALYGNAAAVGLLLSAGADIDEQTHTLSSIISTTREPINTPLFFAKEKNHVEVIKLLEEFKSKIKFKDNTNGKKPLHNAVLNCDLQSVIFLLNLGADINGKDKHLQTALHYAASQGNAAIVLKLLSAGADIEAKTITSRTPLHLAASKGNSEIVKILLEHKANIESKNNTDRTPLHIAVENSHIELVRLLLNAEANINSMDNKGIGYLHTAVSKGNASLVKLLLDYGIDIESKTYTKSTSLHFSVMYKNVEIVKLLLIYDYDKKTLNLQDSNGRTALHYAVINKNEKMVDLLLAQENIDLTLRADVDNETAFDIARRLKLEDIIRKFSDKESKVTPTKSITWVEKTLPQAAGSNRDL